MSTKEILNKVCDTIEDKKGQDLVILDISQISSFTDYFIICSASNPRQAQAICEAVRECLKKEDGVKPQHIEGFRAAEWILLDYIDFIVHIFDPETRGFYKLERLWGDGKAVERAALAGR